MTKTKTRLGERWKLPTADVNLGALDDGHAWIKRAKLSIKEKVDLLGFIVRLRKRLDSLDAAERVIRESIEEEIGARNDRSPIETSAFRVIYLEPGRKEVVKDHDALWDALTDEQRRAACTFDPKALKQVMRAEDYAQHVESVPARKASLRVQDRGGDPETL